MLPRARGERDNNGNMPLQGVAIGDEAARRGPENENKLWKKNACITALHPFYY
jgi:hypothetical protein